MTAYVLSPHLDDAVLSLGQTIAAYSDQADVTVITVFAGAPEPTTKSAYDLSTGFENSHDAMLARRHEDIAAVGMLDASAIHWPFFDRQYRNPPGLSIEEFDRLRTMIGKVFATADPVFVPLGLNHPDHVFVHNAAAQACPDLVAGNRIGMYVYEELPYRVMWPDEAVHKLDAMRDEWEISDTVMPLGQADWREKAAAIRCYESQFPDDTDGQGASDPRLFVEERVWAMVRKVSGGSA